MILHLILAPAIIAFLLIYFGKLVDREEHFALQMICYCVAIIILILVAKGGIDTQTVCEHKINFTTEDYIYGTNYTGYHLDYGLSQPNPSLNDLNLFHKNTTYNYGVYCYEQTQNNSTVILYQIVLVFFFMFVAYLMVYTIWKVLVRFAKKYNGK